MIRIEFNNDVSEFIRKKGATLVKVASYHKTINFAFRTRLRLSKFGKGFSLVCSPLNSNYYFTLTEQDFANTFGRPALTGTFSLSWESPVKERLNVNDFGFTSNPIAYPDAVTFSVI